MLREWSVRGDGAQHKAITALEPSLDYWITTDKGVEHTFVLENTNLDEQSYILNWKFSGYVGYTNPLLTISIEFVNNRDTIVLLDKLSAHHRFSDDGIADAKGELALILKRHETFRFVIKCTRTDEEKPGLSGIFQVDLEPNNNAAEIVERKRQLDGKFKEEDLIDAVKEIEKQDIAFQDWWKSSSQVGQFYPGGRSVLLNHMVEFLRLEHANPDHVQHKLRREADIDHDNILKRGQSLLAEREALAAGSVVAATTSWIPFVGVVMAVVDTGINLALSKQLEKSKKRLQNEIKDDADAAHWLDSYPEIQHGVSLFSDLASRIGGENAKNASFAESLMWYLQCCAVAGVLKTAKQIDKDLRVIGPEEETEWDYEDVLYLLASDTDTPIDEISFTVYQTATRFSSTLRQINLSKPLFSTIHAGIRGLWKKRKFAKTRLARASMGSIKEVGKALSTAKGLATSGKAAGNVLKVRSGLDVVQKINNSSFRQVSRATKLLSVVGLFSGALEAAAAAAQFRAVKKQADDIRRLRHEFAAHVKELWLPEDVLHKLHNESLEAGMCVYVHHNFKGKHAVWYDSVPNLVDKGWNNQISSVRVAKGEKWILYPSVDYRGKGRIVGEGEHDKVENSISSLRKLPDPSPRQALLFLHHDFSGRMFETHLEVSDLRNEHFNNVATSLIVVSGKWIFYEHTRFRGHHKQYSAYKKVPHIDTAFNNKISSLKPVHSA